MLAKLNIDTFLLLIIAVVVVAIIYPPLGASGSGLHIEWVASYGISIVFFLYGLTLAPEKMKAGLVKWRVHLVVQAATFGLFPALVLALIFFAQGHVENDVLLGFFYLAALPGTVSSSVAMTSLARGNVPVAIFNATLSAFLGVFLTPLLMAWYMNSTGVSLPLQDVIIKIVALVLVPTALGQIAHHWLKDWAARNNHWLKWCDKSVILAIVYNSFCDSIVEGVWQSDDVLLLGEMIVAAIALFFIVYGLMTVICKLCGFNREDAIACIFCSSKKSLATGVPLAKVMFGATPTLGLILAPLMLFHFFQLVIVSIIANGKAREV